MSRYVERRYDSSADIAIYFSSILGYLAFLVKMLLIIGEEIVN
jgi:hypothetical protein